MTRNLVLICLDTLRQDFFIEYAPRMVKRSSIVHPQARAASCWSVPSHASMFTGKLPSEHGVHAHNLSFSSLAGETFLSELDEYRRIGVSTNGYASSEFNFDDLFDDFEDIDSGCFEFGGVPVGRWLFNNKSLPNIRDNGTKSALKCLKSKITAEDSPFFAFVNLMETHAPHHSVLGYNSDLYEVPDRWSWKDIPREKVVRNVDENEEYVKYYREIYRASVDYVDRKVSDFIDWLRGTIEDPTTVILTADHGENLGFKADEGLFGHTTSLSEGVLHVPLALVDPPESNFEFEHQYISHLQLRELVLGLLNGQVQDVSKKRIPAEVVGHAITFKSNPTYWDRMLRGVYDGNQKIVWDSFKQSFRYNIDPDKPSWQQLNAEDVEISNEYLSLFPGDIQDFKYKASIAQFKDKKTIDDEVEDHLEELGYL